MPLAFLAPIVEAILAGTQPVDLTAETLTRRADLPLSWSEQKSLFGYNYAPLFPANRTVALGCGENARRRRLVIQGSLLSGSARQRWPRNRLISPGIRAWEPRQFSPLPPEAHAA
jgi:hypothetical protein